MVHLTINDKFNSKKDWLDAYLICLCHLRDQNFYKVIMAKILLPINAN